MGWRMWGFCWGRLGGGWFDSEVEECPARGDLLDHVELNTVRGDDRQSPFRRSQIDQRVVQAFLALMRLEVLAAGERSGDHPREMPRLGVWNEQPGIWD